MSVAALTAAFAVQDVSPSEKLMLLALANYADENGRSYPSQSRLAKDTGLNARTIRRLFTDLEARGLITRIERTRSDGSRTSDLITLHLMSGGAGTVSGLTTFEPSSNQKGTDVPLPRATGRRASRRCPTDWAPSQADLIIAEGLGFSPGEIERELSMIRDGEFAKAYSDWSAFFRNWMRREAKRKPRNDRPSPRQTDRQTAFVDRLRDIDAAMAAAVEQPCG